MKVNTNDPEYAGRDFPVPPPNMYTVIIDDVESKESAKGNQYFNWTFQIIGGEFDGSKLWDMTTITEKALWRLVTLMKAAGYDGDFDTDDLDGIWTLVGKKRIRVLTRVETYEGKDRAKIDSYVIPKADAAPSPLDREPDGDDIDL